MLDELAIPGFRARDALRRIGHARRVLLIAALVALCGNTVLVAAVSGAELGPAAGLRLGAALGLVTALSGTFLGFFLACVDVYRLPYLLKLPLASLLGMAVVGALLALGQCVPLALRVYGFLLGG